jgi:hypothetical protein
LKYLQLLAIYRNLLVGTIPPELGNLSQLQRLYIYSNNFSSPILDSLGNLASAVEIDLSENNLTGGISEALGKRKAVKSSSSSEAVNGNEGASGSEELDSEISTDSEDELNTSSDSDHSSQPSQEVVNVDFEYFDPKPDDFHGVKALLRTYLDDEVWDVSVFTDLVLAQTTVGTVVEAGAVKDVEVEIPPMRVAGIATW